jgi:beta-N-acetylhexosaminidase
MYQQGRTWSFGASRTARLATAFAVGLGRGGALATMKHFPGLGFATENTDLHVVRIRASAAQLAPGLEPYRRGIAAGIPLVMLANATYDAYDAHHAAGWSHTIGTTLLRGQLGFRGVTITDSLDGTATSRGVATDRLALKSARAGTDLLLLTGSEASSRTVYRTLVAAADAGRIGKTSLQRSYERIDALRRRLPFR